MRIEVYDSQGGVFKGSTRGCIHFEWSDAFKVVNWKRKRIRVRHFWDRHLRQWVVQVLTGSGYGVRE